MSGRLQDRDSTATYRGPSGRDLSKNAGGRLEGVSEHYVRREEKMGVSWRGARVENTQIQSTQRHRGFWLSLTACVHIARQRETRRVSWVIELRLWVDAR